MKNLLLPLILGLILVSCNQKEELVEPQPAPLSEELQHFKTETVENLDLNSDQEQELYSALVNSTINPDKPGFLWLVARHLSENLPDNEKEALLIQIGMIEDHLLAEGQCIPLGFEVNLRHPLKPKPEMVASLLRPDQVPVFQNIIQQFQERAQQLITMRNHDLITPQEFFAQMQHNENVTLALLIGDLLDDSQRQQLGFMMEHRALERQQYIRKSYECMIAALELEENEAQTLLAEIMAIEEAKQEHYQLFHNGTITLDELIDLVQGSCEEYQMNLENILDAEQMEIVSIYRILSFRPRP